MTKKEIIKQEIMGTISIYDGDYEYYDGVSNRRERTQKNITVVDIDKLSALLAKYLDIKIEDEKFCTCKTPNYDEDHFCMKCKNFRKKYNGKYY